MNPQRKFAMKKIPPVVMLLIIIGLAVVVTMMVTGKVSESEKEYEAQKKLSGADTAMSSKPVDAKNARTALYTRTYIPARTKIEEKQIEERQIDRLQVWDDAASATSDVIGHTVRHAIPEDAQIRQIDLE